jgi:general secretion pathway protein M
MNALSKVQQWFESLQSHERKLVVGTAIMLIVILFYTGLWEPLHNGVADEQQKHAVNQQNLLWMRQAAADVKALKLAGGVTRKPGANQPVMLLVEQTSKNSAMTNNISKLESSGDGGARVTLDAAVFDQMLIWLHTLEQNHGIRVVSGTIERAANPGTVNARLALSKQE